MADPIADALVRATETYSQKVFQWAEPLDETQFWERPFLFGNSFGHLVLHLTGNLNYYIGAVIAKSGYQRDREREFTDPNPPTKEETLKGFDSAIQMVIETIQLQTSDDWLKPYEGIGMPHGINRLEAVMQCVAHIYHHVGQMIYLQKQCLLPVAD